MKRLEPERLFKKVFCILVFPHRSLRIDFLEQIKVRDFNNPGEAAKALNELGKESGPLKTILAEAARQGNLAEPPTNDGAIAWLKGLLTSKVIGNKKIEDGFKPLIQFTTSPAWAAYQTKLGELRGKLRKLRGGARMQAELVDDLNFPLLHFAPVRWAFA